MHARWALRHRQVRRGRRIPPADKSTPIVRSVRKAEGLDAETARLPKKKSSSGFPLTQMPTEAYEP